MKMLAFLLMSILLFVAGDAFAIETNTLHGSDYYDLAVLLVPVASALANVTKTDSDNKAVGWFSKLVNLFAMNFKRSGL